MHFMIDTALVQNKDDRSKVKVTRSYYVKIGLVLRWRFMQFVLGQAITTMPCDKSKIKVNRSYYINRDAVEV